MAISSVLYSLFGLGGLAALIWVVRSIKAWGNAEYKKEEAEEDLKGIRDAKDIHNRIDTDPAYRDRVRDHFR